MSEYKLGDLGKLLKSKKEVVVSLFKETIVHEQPDLIANPFANKKPKKADSDDDTADAPQKKPTRKDTPEEEERTIFVGNIPVSAKKKQLLKIFRQYGVVQTVRLRSLFGNEPGIRKKKLAVKRDLLHPSVSSINAYVRFETKEAAVLASEEANGLFFQEENHLRVDLVRRADGEQKNDNNKTVFLGNLPRDVNMEDVYTFFESCGAIDNVRVVRDKFTGMGKGFGFVVFKSSDAVELALKHGGSELGGREIRVTRCLKKPKEKSGGKKVTGKEKNFNQRGGKNVDQKGKKFAGKGGEKRQHGFGGFQGVRTNTDDKFSKREKKFKARISGAKGRIEKKLKKGKGGKGGKKPKGDKKSKQK